MLHSKTAEHEETETASPDAVQAQNGTRDWSGRKGKIGGVAGLAGEIATQKVN